MQKYIFIILLSFIACQEKKKSEPIDDRYIVFNLYIGKNLASHSITLDFKDKSVFVHNIINEANFDRFVEDEVEVVEGTLPEEAIKQKNDRIDYNTIYELGFIADNKMTTDTARRYLFDLTKKELLKNEGDNKSSRYIFKNNVR